jgi:hypothetical protein
VICDTYVYFFENHWNKESNSFKPPTLEFLHHLAEVEGALVDSGSEVGKGVKVLACPHQNLSYSDSWCYDRSLRKLQNRK